MKVNPTYSFTATFEDGSTVELNSKDENDDVSLSRTDGTGSRFTDVLEKEKESKLISFVIHNDEKSVGVDLRDGHFEINGIPFWQHRPDRENYQDFRVIYYRTVQQYANVGLEITSAQEIATAVGWQTNDDNGKNVQRVILI